MLLLPITVFVGVFEEDIVPLAPLAPQKPLGQSRDTYPVSMGE